MRMRKKRKTSDWTPQRIKQLRSLLGESQAEFAERLRLSVDCIRKWEQGQNKPYGPAVIVMDSLMESILARTNKQSAPPD